MFKFIKTLTNSKKHKMKNRRKFLKNSALMGTGFFIVPRNVLGGPGFISPSDQLNIAAMDLEEKVVISELNGHLVKE